MQVDYIAIEVNEHWATEFHKAANLLELKEAVEQADVPVSGQQSFHIYKSEGSTLKKLGIVKRPTTTLVWPESLK